MVFWQRLSAAPRPVHLVQFILVGASLTIGPHCFAQSACPPRTRGTWDSIRQRDNVRKVVLDTQDLYIDFGLNVKDDQGRPVLGRIDALAYSTPTFPANEVANPKVWARFSYKDNKIGGPKDDHFSLLAKRMGGHHFGWMNLVTGGNFPGLTRPDGTKINPTFVDPQPGGNGDDASTAINDGLAADLLPWFFNHGDCDLSLFAGQKPNYGLPNRTEVTFNDSGPLATANAEFWFEDRPGTSSDGDIEFRTYLMLLNADNTLHTPLPGFSWSYSQDSARPASQLEQVSLTGILDPITLNMYRTFTQNQGFVEGSSSNNGPTNGDFKQPGTDGDGAFGWESNGPGSSAIIEDSAASDSLAIELTAGSPVTISQIITTPIEPFYLNLGLRFEDNSGSLSMKLGGRALATVNASDVAARENYETLPIHVTDAAMLGQQTLLEITYDGPTATWARVDDIRYSAELLVEPTIEKPVIVSPIAVSESGMGTAFGTPLENLINQSGFVETFVSGETPFDEFLSNGLNANSRSENIWASRLLQDGEPNGELILDFGEKKSIDGLAIWNATLRDVGISVSDSVTGPWLEIGDYTLATKVGNESAVDADVIDLGDVYDTQFVRVHVNSLYRPSDNSAWFAVVNEIAARVLLTAELEGDFNSNGELDIGDIDLLTEKIWQGSTDLEFDLDSSGVVDNDDLVSWIRDAKVTYVGDANLDGEFNSGDLVQVFGAGKYEVGWVNSLGIIHNIADWTEGDWNADGLVNSADLVEAFVDGGYEQGPRQSTSAVPEPSAPILLTAATISTMLGTRRQRKMRSEA